MLTSKQNRVRMRSHKQKGIFIKNMWKNYSQLKINASIKNEQTIVRRENKVQIKHRIEKWKYTKFIVA